MCTNSIAHISYSLIYWGEGLRWCRTRFWTHNVSIFPGNPVCFVRKSFRHDIPYISAELVFGETCRHVIPINFKNRFIKFPPGNQARRQTYQTQKKKKFTNQPVDILFQKNGHVFGFPFRVNSSKLELRIPTIISKNKIQAKGFRMI